MIDFSQKTNNTSFEHKEALASTLEYYDRYIVTQTRRCSSQYPTIAHQEVIDLEIDELIQRVRIKLWRALERGNVRSPYSYIQRIITTEFIDMWRRNKFLVSLPNEEDESYGAIENLISGSTYNTDPAEEVIEQMESNERLQKTIQQVLELPPRQQLAMICSLRERVDDLTQLIDTFKAYSKDIEVLDWPEEQAEKHLLKASIPVARQTLRKKM